MFQVTQIVRFLFERGLRFRNLGFCGHWHDLMESFDCDQDLAAILALTVRIRDLNRTFGGLQVSPRLRFACCGPDDR